MNAGCTDTSDQDCVNSSFCRQKGNFQNCQHFHFTMKKQTKGVVNVPKYTCWLFWLKPINQTWYIISQLNGNSCHVDTGHQNDTAALRTCSLLSPLWERTPKGPTAFSTCWCGDPTTLLLLSSLWASEHEAPRNPGTLLNSVGRWSQGKSGVQLHGGLEPQGGCVLLSWKIPPEKQVSEGWK